MKLNLEFYYNTNNNLYYIKSHLIYNFKKMLFKLK